MRRIQTAGVLCASIVATASMHSAGEVRAQAEHHEAAIDQAYADWVKAVNSKDLEAWGSFLAPGAVFLPPDSPVLSDEQKILDHYAKLFEDPMFQLDCIQEAVEVAASEDMAWSRGHCWSSFTGPDGQLSHGRSKWMKVWIRHDGGEWKCIANGWNSTATA